MTKLEKNFSHQMRLLGFLWFIGLLVSCNPQPSTPTKVTPAIDHAKVDAVYSQMAIAYRKADINMIGELYADTAIYLNPGDALQFGKKQFIRNFEVMYADARKNKAQLSIEFEIVKRTSDNAGKVIDVGYYRFTREKEGEDTALAVGKFITVLQKQTDGAYRFVIDGFNQAPLDAWGG